MKCKGKASLTMNLDTYGGWFMGAFAQPMGRQHPPLQSDHFTKIATKGTQSCPSISIQSFLSIRFRFMICIL
ncbi:hypothetical protein N665_1346s0002 [Sinapis alba]|nr:hypothetical protein N665_1346s0002 [Sinapis alba]